MHSWCSYARSYRHWVTDNAIKKTGQRTIESNRSENRRVVAFQVKKAHREKQSSRRKREQNVAVEAIVAKCFFV